MLINKIEVSDINEMMFIDITSGDIKVLKNDPYVSSRNIEKLNVNKFLFTNDNAIFVEQEIDFKFITTIDKLNVIKQLRFENKTLIFKITFNENIERYFLGIIIGDEIDGIYNMGDFYYTLKIMRITHFINIKTHVFSKSDLTSNFFYPYTYAPDESEDSGFVHSFGSSTNQAHTKLVNNGDLLAPLEFDFKWVDFPKIGINAVPSQTYNSYIYDGVEHDPMDRFILNSFIPFLQISIKRADNSIVNIEQFRDFTKKTYLELEQGVNIVYTENIPEGGKVIIYEQYYNLY